jgi:hypothetical protein
MKRNVLIVLIIFSTLELFSQINKGKTIMSFDGNYRKSNTESGVTTNHRSIQGQYLNVGPSIGYFITDRFIVGVGVDYYWEKETRSNSLFTNNEYAQMETMKIKSKALLPGLFVGYYYPINDKFYFSTNLKISYGNIKTESHSMVATARKIDDDGIELIGSLPSVLTEQRAIYDNDYFSSKISPELTYFVSKKFGLNLGLGGIEYALPDWESDNSSWAINFNPKYWRLGVKCMF